MPNTDDTSSLINGIIFQIVVKHGTNQMPLPLNPNYKTTISNIGIAAVLHLVPLLPVKVRSNIPLLTMNRGQWYDFVVHYKYSYNGDGLIEVYSCTCR